MVDDDSDRSLLGTLSLSPDKERVLKPLLEPELERTRLEEGEIVLPTCGPERM